MGVLIAALAGGAQDVDALAEILVEAVAGGASVSFMHPLSEERARRFWTDSLAEAERGQRVVLGARAGGRLVGTVTLDLGTPENQPHRADIAKLMTRVSHRGQGIASALMREAERLAIERGRSLLTLDTATDGGAGPFYERLGYERVGVIPNYALLPRGGLSGTIVYFKRLGASR